jgi:hypothetical protein
MNSLSVEVRRVMAALATILPEKDLSHSEGVGYGRLGTLNMERAKEVLEELFSFIREGDTDAFDLVQEIKSLLGPSRVSDNLRRLESQIEDYEFEEAQETLERISKELGLTG